MVEMTTTLDTQELTTLFVTTRNHSIRLLFRLRANDPYTGKQ